MKIKSFFILLFILGLLSCGKRVTQEELIREAVELKINQWQLSERNSCKARAMAKAEAYVDSFLLANSLNTKLDTIPKPPKPVKPEKPTFKEKPDTLQ
ncbi:MAG TPA: hypothetical protein VFV79_07380 [Saprospiraceae bacterium]|nr:hypothetical protein [Saprospiraceae bacterium]